MAQAHVQVVVGGQTIPKGLEAALRRVGATASFGPISETLRTGLNPTADVVVVVAPDDTGADCDGLRALFEHVAAHPRATLVLQPEGSDNPRPAHPPAVPVSFSSRAGEEELAARISTMIELRPSLESLHRGTSGQHPDERLARHYRQQLRLASRMQREFLPRALPRYGPVSFTAVYRPLDHVSGDIYDIRRLDADHVAVALIDAQGHGIHAALLTVFIKRALRGERKGNGRQRLPRPDEVLTQLNEELLETDLTECHFAAAVYALLNLRTRRVELARAGAPYPILRHADGGCRLVRPGGIVIGVVPEASFEVASFELAPGESLVLYSDGLEQIIWPATPQRHRPATFLKTRRWARRDGCVAPSQASGAPPAALPVATAPACCGTGVAPPAALCVFDDRHEPAALSDTAGDPGSPSAVPPDQVITTTRWYRQLGVEGVAAALEHLTLRHDTLRRLGRPLDDLTVLAINVDG